MELSSTSQSLWTTSHHTKQLWRIHKLREVGKHQRPELDHCDAWDAVRSKEWKNGIWHTATNQKCDWLIFGWRWGYGHSELFCCPSWHLIKVKSYLDRLGMHPWSLPTPEPKNQKFPKKKTLIYSKPTPHWLTGQTSLRWDTSTPWMLSIQYPTRQVVTNFLKIYHEI